MDVTRYLILNINKTLNLNLVYKSFVENIFINYLKIKFLKYGNLLQHKSSLVDGQ